MNPMKSLEARLRALGYDLSSPMAAAMVAKMQMDLSLRSAEVTFTMEGLDAEKLMAAFADLAEGEEDSVDWGCCDDPQPRILETNNRLFCRNCRLYLDHREEGGASEDA